MNYFILFIFILPYIHTQNPTPTHLNSEIRFGYGLMYENWGLVLNGLNRYYLIVGLEIPIFNFTKDRTVDYFTNFKEHCDNLEGNKRVKDICLNIWPLYFYYRNEEMKYQKQIMTIMTHDLPAVLPSFVPPDFGNFDYSFKQTPMIDPLINLTIFMRRTMIIAL